ncbi:unnamed protein product [Caenorhabditis sp. 36 PRJEB53466]|nr:unnamed protein product [Caenorhabditis sp. 36 PRJEB53466]
MDSLVAGMEGTTVYLDDLMICGRTVEEHNQRVAAVFAQLDEYGFRIKPEKCHFLMPRINFLGFQIDAEGRRPDPAKIQAIIDMPPPKNVTEVRAFLGMIQFYGSVVPALHSHRRPIDALTKKDVKFEWNASCQKAFEAVKRILNSGLLLTHYDPSLPIIVAADASQYGIGGVISHRWPNGTEKAIFHFSRALTDTQQRYSQIEKEGLALVTAVTKFHRYLHGRRFTLRTDHKPLLNIFGGSKGVPIYTANRLQRWATILLNYDFDISYVKTEDFGQADALSRLIDQQARQAEENEVIIAQIEVQASPELDSQCHQLPVTAAMIRKHSKTDHLIQRAMACAERGDWPKNLEKEPALQQFSRRRQQLSIVEGCLMMAHRVVVPERLRQRVLGALHKAHPGIVRMKALARSFVFWPGIDKDIEQIVQSCDNCAAAAKNPIKNVLYSWPKSSAPWTRVHADYAGPIDGIYYLVVVDSFSKWPEVMATKSITSTATIMPFGRIFAQFGNPETLVTDNGTQFSAQLFQSFCEERGINHLFSPPYHPQSNGQAERFVDTFKRTMKKLQGESEGDDALNVFLQIYRSTPCAAAPQQKSPAEGFLGRPIRTPLQLLLPTKRSADSDRNRDMERQFNVHHGARRQDYRPHQAIYSRDFRNPARPTWSAGIVIKKLGNTVYEVEVDGFRWKRHANHLKPRIRRQPLEELIDTFGLGQSKDSTAPRDMDDTKDVTDMDNSENLDRDDAMDTDGSDDPKEDRRDAEESQDAEDTEDPTDGPGSDAVSPAQSPQPLRRSTRNRIAAKRFEMNPSKQSYH